MKLRDGLKVTIGHKTWVDEIPEDVFKMVTKDWKKDKIEEFRKAHEKKADVEIKKETKKVK